LLAAEVEIPQMFTAYAEDLGYLENRLHHYQYYCESCGQAFTSAWGRKQGCIQWCEKGDYFHCPHCGTRHEKHVTCVERHVLIPNKVRLSVKVFKNAVNFEVFCSTIQFQDLLNVLTGRYKEIFRFDITRQTVMFTQYKNNYKIESMEIGNPFKLDLFNQSILGFFQSYSIANTNHKSKLIRVLKVLREAVHKKLEKKLGYKLHSMYVSPGQYYGTFLVPIFNMAYRVTFPNAPNLPVVYRESPGTIERFWELKVIRNRGLIDEVIALTRQKTDFVTALATVYSLPNKPVIRRILGADPFEIGLLSEAFSLCQNYDYAVRLYNGFKKFNQLDSNKYAYEYAPGYINENLLQFLRNMLPIYGEAGVVQLVEKAKETELRDCIRLYQQLNEDNRQAIKTERVKLRDLHDWMARKHRLQTHVNLKFNVPGYIVKRLSMQRDRLKFFLPKESIELLEAGAELHNCVASYGQAMKDNSKWIVLVADDKGKLAACLEVRGRTLVQAKIDRNQPVAKDPKLNVEVIAWAKEAKLEIKTNDLKVQTEEKISMAG